MKLIFTVILAAAVSFASYAQIPLQLSTASQVVKFGPFVDSTDGNTEKTALSLANTDMLCSKNGGTLTAKNSGGGTHDANGWYSFTLDATDTNTAGRLSCFVHKTGALPVFREFLVYPTALYAALFSTAPGAAGGLLQAGANTATTFTGVAASGATPATAGLTLVGGAASTTGGGVSAPGLTSTGGAGAASTNGAAEGIKTVGGGTTTVSGAPGFASTGTGNLSGLAATGAGTGHGLIATSGAGATGNGIQATAASTNGNAFGVTATGSGLIFSTPANANATQVGGQTASASGTVTFPNATLASTTNITAARLGSTGINDILDTSLSGHTTGGTVGGALNSASSAGDPWNTAIPGAYGAGTAGNILGNRLDAAVTTRLAPATSGRTLVVDAAGLADANMVKMGPTGSGTAQTARDIGTSVLLSNGTGTGQLSLTSGAVTTGTVSASAITAASITNGSFTDAKFDTTAGAFYAQGVSDQGTAQSVTSTTLVMRSAAAFADNELVGGTVTITGGSAGVGQSRVITANAGGTDTLTVPAWTTTPSGTVTYKVYQTAPGAAGTLSASDVTAAVWDVTRASHITSGTFGENVVADVTKFGGTAGTFASGRPEVNATHFGGSAGTFSGGRPEVNTTRLSGTALTGRDIGASVLLSNGTGTGQVSLSAGGVTVATNNDKTSYTLSAAGVNAFADTATTGHTSAGTWGGAWNAAGANGDPWSTALPGGYGAGSAGYILGTNLNATISSRMATFTLPTNFSAMAISGGGGVTAGTISDKTGYSLSQSFPANFGSLAISGGGAVTAGTVSDKTGYSLTVAPLTQAQVQAALGTITGTCSSGSPTTCFDAARTEGSATQLVDQVLCTDPATPAERWCSLISGFNAGTHTITTSKTRSASMSGKAYSIYPSTVN